MPLELYGTKGCPYTAELRDDLEFRGRDFVEHDVDADAEALGRMIELSGGGAVPVLVEDGRVVQVGYAGRSCYVATPPATPVKAAGARAERSMLRVAAASFRASVFGRSSTGSRRRYGLAGWVLNGGERRRDPRRG